MIVIRIYPPLEGVKGEDSYKHISKLITISDFPEFIHNISNTLTYTFTLCFGNNIFHKKPKRMYHSFHGKNSIKILPLTLATSFIFILTTPVFSQLAQITPPNGGFRIDGNLIAGTPTADEGDWVAGTSGGYVFYNNGDPVNSTHSKLTRDAYWNIPKELKGFLLINRISIFPSWVQI
jgi:hypothetical protein